MRREKGKGERQGEGKRKGRARKEKGKGRAGKDRETLFPFFNHGKNIKQGRGRERRKL